VLQNSDKHCCGVWAHLGSLFLVSGLLFLQSLSQLQPRGHCVTVCPPKVVPSEDSLCVLCRIAPQYLEGTKPGAAFETDESPLIVFINARSGGRVGAELAGVLARAVGSSQVRAAAQGVA
jgi:hypothetical protein